MKSGPLRRFLTNIICAFIYNPDRRKKWRVVLNSPVLSYLRFIRRDLGMRPRHIHLMVGFRAKNLLIAVNDTYIYKFPLRNPNYKSLAQREVRITTALGPVSPIHIPDVRLLTHGDILVRRYEWIRGMGIRQLPPDDAARLRPQLIHQIAQFVYSIGIADPVEIRDLKPAADATPARGYGWYHWDVFDNFLIDPITGNITAMIDWEDCKFGNFAAEITRNRHRDVYPFMDAVWAEYNRLYDMSH